MSTPPERLQVVHGAFSNAYQRRSQDLKEAKSTAQADQILDNLDELEIAYLRAARNALDANGTAVEEAFEAADAASKAVDEAYRRAKALPEKIRLVTSVAQNVKQLVEKASGA